MKRIRIRILLWSVLLVTAAGLCRAQTINEGTFYVSMPESVFQSQVAAASGQVGSILNQFRAYGVSAGITLVNNNTAKIWASGGGVYVYEYVVNTGGGGAGGGASGGGTPVSSASIMVNQIFRQNIFDQARPNQKPRKPAQSAQPEQPEQPETTPAESKPGAFYQQVPGFGRLNSGSADMFYNKWKVDDADGSTFGINPSVTYGEIDQLTLTLPVQAVSPSGGGDTTFVLGLDGLYKHPFTGKWDKFAAGVHVYGMGLFGGGDTANTFGGGPFLSYKYRINPQWIVSAGGLLELTKPSDSDSVTELVPGVNLGYNLSENVALNGYVIYYKSLNSSDSGDDAYEDIGADVQWVRGSWSLSGGIKVATGLDSVDSTEVYLGSNWIF